MSKAIIKYFKQVARFRSRNGIAQPVVEDEEINFSQAV